MARRARRTRIGRKQNEVLSRLIQIINNDEITKQAIADNDRGKAFGRTLGAWLDSSKESVIDRYIDEDAEWITGYAINTYKKHYMKSDTPKRTNPITQ